MLTFLLLILLISSVILVLWLIDHVLVVAGMGAPYVCTPYQVIEKVILSADLKPGDVFYELGCGDARVLCAFAKKYPDVNFVGVDLLFGAVLMAKLRVLRNGLKNVTIKRGDMFKEDLSNTTHLFLWILPHMMHRLEPTLERLGSSITVLAMDFKFAKKQPFKEIPIGFPYKKYAQKLYIYHYM